MMQLNEVGGVPVVNDYLPPGEPERPRTEKEQKAVDEEGAKFHWRVNMLVDRTVVEAFANNGSVVRARRPRSRPQTSRGVEPASAHLPSTIPEFHTPTIH